jgi:hypothetical protein
VHVTRPIAAAIFLALAACANTSAIEPAASSKSHFEGAVYSGKTVTLDKATPGAESWRLYEQGATGFVSLQSVRSEVEERASAQCDRSGKVMHGVTERDATPPYMLGNFPRVELVFECVDKPHTTAPAAETDKYEKLAHLKNLLDNGTLTQQDFDQEKAKVLAEPCIESDRVARGQMADLKSSSREITRVLGSDRFRRSEALSRGVPVHQDPLRP